MKYLIGVVFVLAVLGLGYYWYGHSSLGSQEGVGTQEEAQGGIFNGSFTDLLSRGGDWRCTLESSVAGASSSGTTYVSSGMVRADITSAVEGYGTMESHMIADGTNVYTWSPMMPFGIKAPMTQPVAGGTGENTPTESSFDVAGSHSYHCEPWSADRTMFELPSGVTFRSF